MKKYLIISVVIIFLLCSSYVNAFEPLFDEAMSFTVGREPEDVAIGDFNGDGHLDLAVANYGDDELTLLLGKGDGTFENPYPWWFGWNPDTGSRPVALTAFNFDNDEREDIAVVNKDSDDVYVFRGEGGGGLSAMIVYYVGESPSSIAAADFNEDGYDDLAVTNSGSDDVTVCMAGHTYYYTVGNDPRAVTTGDFDEDGNIDLAVANYDSDDVSILLGEWDGTFADAVNISSGHQSEYIITGDFNEDGHTDLAVSGYGLTVMLGAGDGTFVSDLIYNHFCLSVAVGDYNEDGHTDLAGGAPEGIIFLGAGDGTFTQSGGYEEKGAPVTSGDFNEDDHLDLACLRINSCFNGTVSIILGNGDGTFPYAESYFTEDIYPTSVSVGDFNEDNNMDLAVTNDYQGTVYILTGDGSGMFTAGELYDVGCGPQSSAVGDFNEDGYQDLAVGNGCSTYISVLLGIGDGTFESEVNYSAGSSPDVVITGDFNEDGHTDLAISGSDDVYVLIGKGGGSFEDAVGYDLANRPFSILTGDFNGDGNIDIAVTITASDEVSVLPGIGDGTFGSAISTGVDNLSGPATTGDFNEDGYTDLAISKAYPDYIDKVSILLGQGDGTFNATSSEYLIGISPWGIIAEDFDGDSHMDIATANGVSQNISILMGKGDGTFGGVVGYSVGDFPSFVTTGDFNNDSKPDLAVPLYEDDVVTILLNISEGGTATMLSSYLCSPANDGIEISWTLSELEKDMSFSIYRQTDGSDTFLPIDAEITRKGDLSYKAIDSSCLPGSVCRYRVEVTDSEGTRTLFTTEKVTVESPELALSQNYPNPFNPSTTIYYSLPERCRVTLDIYDVSGRRIARLEDGIREAGTHQAKWSGLNKNGASVSSGVYLYKLTTGKSSITRKMVLMR
ncbi:MAG: FG-GAP-like repeat-containing protein [Candidatus Krumholzibacteriales bacterium]